jgi:hypothetical protein
MLEVGHDHRQRCRRSQHCCRVERLAAHGDLVEQVAEVDDRPAGQGAAQVDEARVVDVLVVDPRAETRLPGEKIRAVDRASRRAVDRVEGASGALGSSAATMPAEITPRIAPPSIASPSLAPSSNGGVPPRASRARRTSSASGTT